MIFCSWLLLLLLLLFFRSFTQLNLTEAFILTIPQQSGFTHRTSWNKWYSFRFFFLQLKREKKKTGMCVCVVVVFVAWVQVLGKEIKIIEMRVFKSVWDWRRFSTLLFFTASPCQPMMKRVHVAFNKCLERIDAVKHL